MCRFTSCGILLWLAYRCVSVLHAQPPIYFNDSYDLFGEADAGATCLADDSVYYFSGAARRGGPWNIFLGQAGMNGVLQDTNTYGVSGFEVGGRKLVKVGDNVLLATQDREYTLNRYQVGLVKYNKQLDTLWHKQFGGLADNDICQSMIYTSTGHLLISGSTNAYDTLQSQIMLIKTDTNGSLEWSKNYGGFAWENGYGVAETSDGGYVLSGYRDPSGANNRRLLLIRTDSDGNQLWEKTYGGPYNDWGGYVTRSREGGFMLSGYHEKSSSLPEGAGWLIKVDDTGAVQWNKEFNNHSLKHVSMNVIQLPDSSYAAIGTVEEDGIDRGWIYKVDRLGNFIWSRTYTRNLDNHNYFWDFAPTPDGGFVVCGTTHNATQDAWLLKLDSLGCNEPNCDTVVGVIHVPMPAMQLEVWPNPTDGVVHVRLPVQKVGKIEVVDVMGRVSLASPPNPLSPGEGGQFTADLSGLPSGVYVVRVEADGRTWQAKVVKQ